jgi:hypothetical protein
MIPNLVNNEKNLFRMYLVCRENIFLLQKNLRLNQNPLAYSDNNLGSRLATMNESCVPKCFNLWKTCQDISLHSVKNIRFWLWIENVFVSILGSPTWFSVSLLPTFPLQEMKFPFPPGASPDDPVVCHLLPCKTSKGGEEGNSVLWITM